MSIDSALVRLKKKELQGKLDVGLALAIGREVDADYVVLGQIDEMSMKRFRATVPIGGYRSYQGLTTVRLYPYKVIDGEAAGEVMREVAEGQQALWDHQSGGLRTAGEGVLSLGADGVG